VSRRTRSGEKRTKEATGRSVWQTHKRYDIDGRRTQIEHLGDVGVDRGVISPDSLSVVVNVLDERRGEEGSDGSDANWLAEGEPVVFMESMRERTLFSLSFSTSKLRRYEYTNLVKPQC